MNETRYKLAHLREWREYRRLSLAELAALASLTKATVSRLELLRTEAHGTTVQKLADALRIARKQLLEESPGERERVSA